MTMLMMGWISLVVVAVVGLLLILKAVCYQPVSLVSFPDSHHYPNPNLLSEVPVEELQPNQPYLIGIGRRM